MLILSVFWGNESAGLAKAQEFLEKLFLEENTPIREFWAYAITDLALVRSHILIPNLAHYLANYRYKSERFLNEFFNLNLTVNLNFYFLPKLILDTALEQNYNT